MGVVPRGSQLKQSVEPGNWTLRIRRVMLPLASEIGMKSSSPHPAGVPSLHNSWEKSRSEVLTSPPPDCHVHFTVTGLSTRRKSAALP